MKHFPYCLLSLLLLLSCDKPSIVLLPELQHAEAVIWEHPDSALAIIDSMQRPSPSDNAQYATWCLLLTQARDKNYIKHTSDSLINIALRYFEKQDDTIKKATALFYAGQVNNDLYNVEKATNYYIRAKEVAKETADYKLLALICSNLGMIYAYRPELKEEAKFLLQEAYRYSVKAQDSIYISRSLSELGRIYGRFAEWDSVIYFYTEAMRIAKQVNNLRALSLAQSEIVNAYISLKEYSLAIESLKQSKEIRIKNKLGGVPQIDLSLGDVYRYTGQYDSAVYYLSNALKTDNIYTKRSIYLCFYYLNKQHKKYKEAIIYNDLYQTYADSVRQMAHSKELLEMQQKYDHEKLINTNNQLKINNSNLIKTSLLILILVLCVTALLIFNNQRKLLKKERQIQKIKEEMRFYVVKLRENEIIIQQNKEIIQTISSQLEGSDYLNGQDNEHVAEIEQIHQQKEFLQRQNKVLQNSIQTYTQSLQEKDIEIAAYEKLAAQNIRLLNRERFLINQLERRIDILNQLKLFPKYITKEQWPEVIDTVNLLYNNFTDRLQATVGSLTESDLQYCCLIKLHLTTSTIAVLTAVSPPSVTKRKQRIRDRINQHITSSLDKEQSIETYLWSY